MCLNLVWQAEFSFFVRTNVAFLEWVPNSARIDTCKKKTDTDIKKKKRKKIHIRRNTDKS